MFTNIISSIFGVLRVLFPKKGSPVWSQVQCETNQQTTRREYHEILLKEKSILGDTVHQISYYRYKSTQIRPVLLDIKRGKLNNRSVALAESVLDELISVVTDRFFSAHTHARKYLVHIPSSAFFTGKKDFDHMEKVLTHFELVLEEFFIVCKNALVINPAGSIIESANKDTNISRVSQHHLRRQERFAQSKDKFKLHENFMRRVQRQLRDGDKVHIYCIDDITTTGATFTAVREIFRQKLPGARVHCVAIGH